MVRRSTSLAGNTFTIVLPWRLVVLLQMTFSSSLKVHSFLSIVYKVVLGSKVLPASAGAFSLRTFSSS